MRKSLSTRVFARLKHSFEKRCFDRVAQGILQTAPLRPQGGSPLFLSMVCHRDLTTYLLAIKSLYTAIGHGKVAIINDGSLTSHDLAILHNHIPGLATHDIAAVDTAGCPRGGTWERLVKIIELSNEDFVIQVDADTLVSAPIPEVVQCWQANRSFLLGTGSGQSISPASDVAQMVRGWIETNGWAELPVGVEAEAALDQLPGAAQRCYVHASSGFAGFARNAVRIADLAWFSAQMSGMLSVQRWSEWGSEQIASNYILANAPEATVLPFPRYACFEPHLKESDHAFLHFLGAYRYDDGVYRCRAAEFMSRYNQIMR